MERYPGLFQTHIHGVGASLEKRWQFCGYDPDGSLALGVPT